MSHIFSSTDVISRRGQECGRGRVERRPYRGLEAEATGEQEAGGGSRVIMHALARTLLTATPDLDSSVRSASYMGRRPLGRRTTFNRCFDFRVDASTASCRGTGACEEHCDVGRPRHPRYKSVNTAVFEYIIRLRTVCVGAPTESETEHQAPAASSYHLACFAQNFVASDTNSSSLSENTRTRLHLDASALKVLRHAHVTSACPW
ncbi:hypothetical protein PLICRDRAFT_251089 [Plicaturopsis crispa FD-325 SS-3]|nr:hypothetical protein PLICRDRAFT_251089 [Plicaturopsis crispa FD-325 SS-3]